MPAEQFQETFKLLKQILKQFESALMVQTDKPDEYYLNSRQSYKGRPMFFGAVQVRKSYVSFHLMPVYAFPELLKNLSPALKARMQGKSCFNFKRVSATELEELAALAKSGLERFKKEGLI